jgi:hypothetical protein
MIYDMIYMIQYETIYDMICDMIIYLLTAIELTPGGSSTYIFTNSTQNGTMKQNTQNGTYITIRIYNN